MLYSIFLNITISELIPKTITINTRNLVIIVILFIILFLLPRLMNWIIATFFTPQNKEIYQVVIAPYFSRIVLIFLITLCDLVLLNLAKSVWLKSLELILSISLVILLNWLSYEIFQQIFNNYLLSAAVKNKGQFNSEFLLLSKFLVNITITFVVIFSNSSH